MAALTLTGSRSTRALWLAAMLLSLAGLAAVGLETVSFGHSHRAGSRAPHHSHLYLGAHGHPHAQPDTDNDHHEVPAPDPQERDAPQETATISVVLMLFQPVFVSVVIEPLTNSSPVVLALALPRVVRPAVLLIPPRAPPASTPPDAVRRKRAQHDSSPRPR